MTLDHAKAAAKREADATGRAHAVYRFRGWVPGSWGVRDRECLPSDAEIAASFEPTVAADAPPREGMLF